MHAEDDRYAKFFLFTEAEVKILCEESNNQPNQVCGPFTYSLFIHSIFLVKYW
jgi:hypothetical protein